MKILREPGLNKPKDGFHGPVSDKVYEKEIPNPESLVQVGDFTRAINLQ